MLTGTKLFFILFLLGISTEISQLWFHAPEVAGAPLSPWGTVASQPPQKDRFDPDGSFWIQGTPPPEFEDFGGINLNSKRLRRLPAAGVDLVRGGRLAFKSLAVKKDGLAFTTLVVRGISYSFSGRFLKGGVFAAGNLDPETPVLEGTLTKWRRGRKVGEARLKFTYFGGT